MKCSVVIPNWNGKAVLKPCLDSLMAQTQNIDISVVDNGSTDGSADFIKQNFPTVKLVQLDKNQGFAGGVNAGIKQAMADQADYIALFNNDAVAEKNWAANLLKSIQANPKAGIVTGKLLRSDKTHLDSTGECYSIWGMPFPRGRNEVDSGQYDNQPEVFGATGGASLYRAEMLKQIGLFDERFFAYFEDTDISFRAQLAGWKVIYEPSAVAYHAIGSTSSKLGDFTTYHSVKNFMLLYAKNMPTKLYLKYLLLFGLQLFRLGLGSLLKGKIVAFTKGFWAALKLHPSTTKERQRVQSSRQADIKYIESMLYHHRPPKPPKLEK